MSRILLGCVSTAALALTVTVGAQYPPTQTPPQQTPPATRTPTTQDQARMVTVEGCLMREADVAGRKPNITERAGIAEDYILTSTRMIKGSAPATGTAQARPGETPIGTSGTRGAMMYEVKGIDDDQLKQHVAHRVQIDGTFENVDRSTATPESRTPADDLVEIRGTVIRQVSGQCPAK